jgi:hypothetical protein
MQRSYELLQSAQAARHSDRVCCTLTGSQQMRLLRRSRTGVSSVCSAATSSCSRRRLPVIVTVLHRGSRYGSRPPSAIRAERALASEAIK